MAVEEVDEEGKFVRLRNKSNEVGLPGRVREKTWKVKGWSLRGGPFLTSDQGKCGYLLQSWPQDSSVQ